ncbi:MAG: GntR family transcriptional regulator [Faecalibacillus sp.]
MASSRYPEIKKYILEQIENNNYQEDVMLPTEKEFTEKFNVSRMTVRRAFDELIQDGVLYRKRGYGVFIAKKKIKRSILKLSTQHDEELKEMFNEITIKVLDFKIVHNHPFVKKYLDIENEDVYQIKRIQLGDNQPIVYENIFLPCRYFSNLKKEDFNQSLSNIKTIKEITGRRNINHRITVEAKVATMNLASLLHISANDPVLQLNIVVVDENETKYYCGINRYPGNSFSYCSE